MAEELLASVIEALVFHLASTDPPVDRHDADARQVLGGRPGSADLSERASYPNGLPPCAWTPAVTAAR